jgi:phosphate transport system permease protein
LGNESLRFFTRVGWVSANNQLVEAVDASATMLNVATSGHQYQAGDLVQIGEEATLVTEVVEPGVLSVERGHLGTQAVEHPASTPLQIGEQATLAEFLTGTKWQPQIGEFGILPLATSTFITTIIAMLVAVPLGLGAAVYLSEYAPARTRATLKPILEILAGVPTVVYGYFALTFMTPLLRALLGQDTVQVYNMAAGGLVMGIMIIPTISSMSEDALSAVPRSLREASYGLGATRFETTVRVLIPAALSGIIAAFILGVSRAVGETMIMTIAVGAGPKFTLNPFEGAETITGHIARISTGDLSFGSIDYNSLFALGLALFVMTLVLNLISGAITRRFREVYA